MTRLTLHAFHEQLSGQWTAVNGAETIAHYGDFLAEHAACYETAAVLDLSFRSRLCLTGSDRMRFLHGQVTNDVKSLQPGEGCYAALTTAKGKMQADLNIYCLKEEVLLDSEPGLTSIIAERLERYIVADDVQVVEVGSSYGLLSVQGPQAAKIVSELGLCAGLPKQAFSVEASDRPELGEIYLINQPRLGSVGYDLFVPIATIGVVAERLSHIARSSGARWAGWAAFETARIEMGIPRFGIDMDESHFPQECGIEARAVSYTKGCYIGQETLNRIHTMGHVNRLLRGLRLESETINLPPKGAKLFHLNKEVGYVTSAAESPKFGKVALGYVRKEASQTGNELALETPSGRSHARVAALPFN